MKILAVALLLATPAFAGGIASQDPKTSELGNRSIEAPTQLAERTDSTAGGSYSGSGTATEAPNGTVRYQDYAPQPQDYLNGAGTGAGTGSIHNPSPSTTDPKTREGAGPNTSGTGTSAGTAGTGGTAVSPKTGEY